MLVSANAGAAKTSSSVEVATRLQQANPSHKTRYLVFGTANAAFAKSDFQATAQVSTIHALAYHHTIKPFKLNSNIAGWLTWKDFPKSIRIPFGKTADVINLIDTFCASGYTDLSVYNNSLADPLATSVLRPALQAMDLMASGKMRITHSFYLKLFHIMVLNGTIKLPPVDTLLVDEVNDLSIITLDIVDAYPATQKVLVGDPKQAIHGWMGTVNAFDFYKNKGTTVQLSTSFRLTKQLAKPVERFIQKYCDPNCKFVGRDYDDETINQTAYLCRTNTAVIKEMAKCSKIGKPYKLAHSAKVKQMFKLPLAIAYAKPGFKQRDPDLQHLQSDIDHWGAHEHLQQTPLLTYLLQANENEQPILDAIKLILQHTRELIIKLSEEASSKQHTSANYLLATAHTSKGLTTDHVIIDESMNLSLDKIKQAIADDKSGKKLLTDKDYTNFQQEYNLYHVAISRARFKITNAKYLEELY